MKSGQVFHLWNGRQQRLRHISATEIARPKIKLAHPMSSYGIAFDLVITIPFILCKNDPSAVCNKGKPYLICCSAREGISVAPVLNVVDDQGLEDRLAVVQILIQVEDEIVKLQLLGFPSGLPLRSAFLRGHIPWLVRASTHEH